ncbi:unnamed protein product [Closterium sp. NIES-53]
MLFFLLCIPAAALGASESGTLPGTAPAEALHTFTLDLGASRSFFCDITTLTPLPAPISARLADPSGGPVVARSSTLLLCPAVPSGSLSGLHLPSFSKNLVSTAALQDAMVTTTTPGGQRVSICTCTRTGRHLATFTRRPGSSLYTLATESPQVAASAQVSASGQVAASCSCRLLSHQTLLWHHRLGHPSLPRLRGMHSCLLVSGLPRSLPPLPPSLALPCLPCVEGRQRAAPHSFSLPPTTAPLQTLHLDVWGSARVCGQSRERYFLLVVDDYTWYTTIFPLCSKGQVIGVLIPWIRTVRLQLRERFGQDLPLLRLHSHRGCEFFSNLLRDFYRGEGILQLFPLPDSPQQNGIAERRIGLVMEVARTSMIHAAALHFCGRLRFDVLVPFYRLFPYRSAPLPPPPLFLAPSVYSLTSYILQDEAMEEVERPSELLAHVNYVALVKQGGRAGQRGQSGGGGRSGWKPTKDANKKKSAKDRGRGGGSRRRECWLCGDFDHLSFECPDRSDSDDDDAKGGHGSRRPHQVKKQVLILDVLYVLGVRVNLLSAGQLKENGVKLQEDGDGMLLVTAAGGVLGCASYTGRVLCTDLCPCSAKSTTPTMEVVALWAIVSVTKSTPDRLRATLAHVGMHTIRSSEKHEVATGLDLKSASGADLPCISCVGGKLAQHTFPDQGSDADDVLAVVHVDLCGPFRVAAKDGSLYFLLLKDRKTRYVWVRPVTKKSDAMQEFAQWLAWHLALQKAVWVRNYLEQSTLQPGTTPYQLVTGKKPDSSLARVWGCMAQFLVPEQQRGGKLQPKGRWGLHLGVLEESKGWELLDIADNRVVTTSDVVFYGKMSLEVWKSEHGPASGRTPTIPLTDTSTATLPLLAKVGEPAAEVVEDVPSPFPSPAPRAPPLVADMRGLTPVSTSGDEGKSGALPVVPAKSIDGGRRDVQQVDVRVKSTLPGEEQAEEVQPTVVKSAKGAGTRQQLTGEQAAAKPIKKQFATRQSAEEPTIREKSAGKHAEVQLDDEGSKAGGDGGDAKESTDSDVVEVRRGPRQSGRIWRPPDFYVPAAFTTAYNEVNDDLQYNDAEQDEDFPELDPDMHANPEHRWDISTMTVKEALASWKGKAVKAAMEEEIRSLVGMGTWELVEHPPGVNIMKNRWVLTTKYHIDDTVEREKARLVVKGFTHVYGADYDKTYAPVSSYVTLRIFLSIVAVLDLNLMKLDMKNAFLQSKLDRVLYMYQPDYFNDGTGWKKSQVDTALYFKVGANKVACWVLVYVHDLLTANNSIEMLKEMKELLEAAFELREISLCEVDRFLAYLANTRDTALEFGGGAESLKLDSYVDADDAGDKQNQTSTGGYVFVFGGAAVSWSSQRIKCMTLSSTESEYVAATEAGKEGCRLCFLLAEFRQLDAGTPTVLRVDNKLAITVAEGMGLTGNFMHMERRQAWLQHMVKREKFSLRFIPTVEQPANFLTKALHYQAFNRCSVAIGQVRLVDVGDGDNDVQQ